MLTQGASETGNENDSKGEGVDRYSCDIYKALCDNPLGVLRNYILNVNYLPKFSCATSQELWFAAHEDFIAVRTENSVASSVAGKNEDIAIKKPMIVSSMRSLDLPVGVAEKERHQVAGTFDVSAGNQDLWVTEMQTGCTTLALDWGGKRYSFLHLQPSAKDQFNRLGQIIISTHNFANDLYKNTWLKREMTTIVSAAKDIPKRYIMVQSLFENGRGNQTQVVGVRNKTDFVFYRQIQKGNTLFAEELKWSAWCSYLPFFSY